MGVLLKILSWTPVMPSAAILGHDLTPQGGELTPTLKIKRAVVNRRYERIFAALYEGEPT